MATIDSDPYRPPDTAIPGGVNVPAPVWVAAWLTLVADSVWFFRTVMFLAFLVNNSKWNSTLHGVQSLVLAGCLQLAAILCQTVGAILLLRRMRAGRFLTLGSYWLFFVYCAAATALPQTKVWWLFGLVGRAWFVGNLVFIGVVLYCLHSRSARKAAVALTSVKTLHVATATVIPVLVAGMAFVIVGLWLIPRMAQRAAPENQIAIHGGWRLLYEIDHSTHSESFRVDDLVARLRGRLDPADHTGVTVEATDDDHVALLIPKNYPGGLDEAKRRIVVQATFEFRIVANEKYDADAILRAEEMLRAYVAGSEQIQAPDGYEWMPLYKPDEFDPGRLAESEMIAVKDGYVLTRIPNEVMRVTGSDIARAFDTVDGSFRPAIGFELSKLGARRFARLTRRYQPEDEGQFRYRLAIILDGKVVTAPAINAPIEDGKGIIEGDFLPSEVEEMIGFLSAAELPAQLNPEPVTEEIIPPEPGW